MLKSTKLSNPHSFLTPYYALARCIISSSRVQPGVALKRYSLRPHLHCYQFHHSGHHGSSANHPLLSADASPSPTSHSINRISPVLRPCTIIHRSTILLLISGRNFFKQGIISRPIQTFCYHVPLATTARVTDQG